MEWIWGLLGMLIGLLVALRRARRATAAAPAPDDDVQALIGELDRLRREKVALLDISDRGLVAAEQNGKLADQWRADALRYRKRLVDCRCGGRSV